MDMKHFIKILMITLILLLTMPSVLPEENKTDLLFFYGRGCSHCGRMESFLVDMQDKYPELNVIKYEIYFDRKNNLLLEDLADAFDHEIQGVPTTFIDEKIIVGFSNALASSIEKEVKRCIEERCASPLDKMGDGKTVTEEAVEIVGSSSPVENPEKTEMTKKLTISAVIGAAAVDAINPCAFAVLIILLTTVLACCRERALWTGLAFTLSIYISYFLMGIGLYSAIQAVGFTHIFYIIVACLAIVVGLFNLKDYLWYGKWFVMEVPMSWRPRLNALIKGITSIPGAFLIGFAVSLFLLPCTSGPYIVILGLLAKTTTKNHAIVLLLLYNLVFVLPMLVITCAIYFGFTTTEQAEAWRKTKLKVLHLIAGIIILLLGIGMFIALYLGMI